jgi:ABC-type nickel/cobalt efflux system permease component RcnA
MCLYSLFFLPLVYVLITPLILSFFVGWAVPLSCLYFQLSLYIIIFLSFFLIVSFCLFFSFFNTHTHIDIHTHAHTHTHLHTHTHPLTHTHTHTHKRTLTSLMLSALNNIHASTSNIHQILGRLERLKMLKMCLNHKNRN